MRRSRMEIEVVYKHRAHEASAKTYSRVVQLLQLIYELADHEWLTGTLRLDRGGRPRRRSKSAKTPVTVAQAKAEAHPAEVAGTWA